MTPLPPFSNPITTASSSSTSSCCTNTNNTFALTLHLVRHAETVANCQGIVLGQSDSPLTCKGIQQAQAAGVGVDCSYWKVFSSDLGRCVHTARLMVGLLDDHQGVGDDDDDENDKEIKHSVLRMTIIQDKRLRERAKGIREGRSKFLSLEEIQQLLLKEEEEEKEKKEEKARKQQEQDHVLDEETEMQVLQRFQNWLEEIIQDAYQHHLWEQTNVRRQEEGDCDTTSNNTNANTDTNTNTNSHDTKHSHPPYQGSFHVLAVTHSGTLRIVLERLVGTQIPRNARREEKQQVKEVLVAGKGMECQYMVAESGGTEKMNQNDQKGRLVIPNTSKTVIQFTKSSGKKDVDSAAASGVGGGGEVVLLGSSWWNATLLDYTNVSHLKNEE